MFQKMEEKDLASYQRYVTRCGGEAALRSRLSRLEAVADAVRAVVDNESGCASGGWREGSAFLHLADALDALDNDKIRKT